MTKPSGAAASSSAAPPPPCCCLVPVEAAGVVVGRGGSTVDHIAQHSGAQVAVSGEDDTPPALSDRIVTIRGDAEQKQAACVDIVRIVHQSQDVGDEERGVFIMLAPASSTGYIVGPKGSTITSLIQVSGAEVSISRNSIEGTDLHPISIAGTLAQTVAATARLDALLQQLADRGRLNGTLWTLPPPRRPPRQQATELRVPSPKQAPSLPPEGSASGWTATLPQSATEPALAHAHGGTSRGSNSQNTTPGRRSLGGGARSADSAAGERSTSGGASVGRSGSGSRCSSASGARSATPSRGSRSVDVPLNVPGGQTRRQVECKPIHLVVTSKIAAWIVGRGGRSIAEVRSKSGASVEVPRSGGAARLVEIDGTRETQDAAIELLIGLIETFPEGAPGEVRFLVPPSRGSSASSANRVIDGIRRETGAEISLIERPHPAAGPEGWLLALGGKWGPLIQAAQLAAAQLPVSPEDLDSEDQDSRAGSRSASRSGSRSASRSRGASFSVPSEGAPTRTPPRTPTLASLSGAAARPTGLRSGAPPSNQQSPSEAALLRLLLSGPEPNQAQLQLTLPAAFVREVLTGGAGASGKVGGRTKLRAVEERSGSQLRVGAELHGTPPTVLVATTGTMLGNAMAALYIQELLLEYRGRAHGDPGGDDRGTNDG